MKSASGILDTALRQLRSNLLSTALALIAVSTVAAETTYPLEVQPPEHRRMTDPKTGAELWFLTTAPENDANLYYH